MTPTGWDLLACPVCRAPLTAADAALRCPAGHSFDVARQGYVNLLGHAAPANADTAAMVAARERFLAAGHYDRIAAALADWLGRCRRVLEVGAGTGFYLARVLDAAPEAVGLACDISVAAVKRAARAHPRMTAVVADTWAGLPVLTGAVDAVLCVFAPRNPAEFARVLAPGGLTLVVTPNPGHLVQLRQAYHLLGIESDKQGRLERNVGGHLEPVTTQRLCYPVDLTGEEASDLIGMGPNAFHAAAEARRGLAVDVNVQLTLFRRPTIVKE